jgi:uncharacterized protein (TIGR02145 family)
MSSVVIKTELVDYFFHAFLLIINRERNDIVNFILYFLKSKSYLCTQFIPTNMKVLLGFLFLFSINLTFSQLYTPGSGVSDVEGNNYPTININGQEWMAENLRTTKYSNGDSITRIINGLEWVITTNGAWTYYNNNDSLNYPYGKLYNWYTINDSRNVCPSGWRVPSLDDFSTLESAIGGVLNNALKLKVSDTIYWPTNNPFGSIEYNNNGTNESGFSGIPIGSRYGMSSQPTSPDNGGFYGYNFYLNIWTNTPALNSQVTDNSGNGLIWIKNIRSSSDDIVTFEDQKESGHSIRCMRESVTGLYNTKPNNKKLIKVLDLMGRETQIIPNQILIHVFDDGSIEKFIQIQE